MKINHYRDLVGIITCMSDEEIKVARAHLKAYNTSIQKDQHKTLMLFNRLVKKPTLTKEAAKKKVNPDTEDEAFDHIIKRLIGKLLESMSLDVNTNRKGVYGEPDRHRFMCRKDLLQFPIVKGRGVDELAILRLERVVRHATKFELYSELVDALYELSWQRALQLKYKEFETLQTEARHYEELRDAVLQARNWYSRHFLASDRSGLQNEKVGLLTEAVSFLQHAYQQTNSANIGFFYYTLLAEYYLAIESYKLAVSTGNKLVDLINDSVAIFAPKLLSTAYYDLGINSLYVYDFEAAIRFSHLSLEHCRKTGHKVLTRKDTEVFALHYLNRPQEALALVDELIAETDADTFAFHFAKRNYLRACSLFALGRFQEALTVVSTIREIGEDKEGWNIGIRLLTILCDIELENHRRADLNIQAFQKHLDYTKNERDIRTRDFVIYRILERLEKNSFHFKLTAHHMSDELLRLDSSQEGYRWEVNTHELIPFQSWFQSKLHQIQFEFEIPESLLNRATEVEVEFQPLS